MARLTFFHFSECTLQDVPTATSQNKSGLPFSNGFTANDPLFNNGTTVTYSCPCGKIFNISDNVNYSRSYSDVTCIGGSQGWQPKFVPQCIDGEFIHIEPLPRIWLSYVMRYAKVKFNT